MTRLLAKSYDRKRFTNEPPDYALLTQHSRDVAEACTALARVVGRDALMALGLDPRDLGRLATMLRLQGWVQDLGKANSHFQAMVSGEPEIRQLLRHETISGLLLWLEDALRAWLEPLGDAVLPALWGAIGHHRKFDDRTRPGESAPLAVYVAHPDFRQILCEMGADLGLPPPPSFSHDITIGASKRDGADRSAASMLSAMMEDFRDAEDTYRAEKARRLVAVVKGLGVAADVAASAIARRGVLAARYSLDGFVQGHLTQGLTVAQLDALIRRWAWDHTDSTIARDESRLPPEFIVRPFQTAVAASTSRLTLAEAGCGSGKSLAAYLWARKWCDERGDRPFRLFFCLPTTGTTTEHYKDYALESGVPTSLAHSRALVDLRTMAETAAQEEGDETQGGTAAHQALAAEREKIESLALWGAPLVVATTDTVLGLLANARRGLCSLPAIVQAGIVFDEIHAFDDQLFGHLMVFLKNFPGLPVLLMTASLPEERRHALLRTRPDLVTVAGPRDLERLPRYLIEEAQDESTLWDRIGECLSERGKVLWVRNRVDWANAAYEAARVRFPNVHVDVYHSRFRYRDRSERHRRVIDRFQRAGEPALLVATQVAEMSLDLSADLLVTDEASIPALIQRLGRLNRRATLEAPGEPKAALVLAVPSGHEPPYEGESLLLSRRWRAKLASLRRPLHQRDLAEQFARLSTGQAPPYATAEAQACFFGVAESSGLWRTTPGRTRAEGHTVSVLRASDVAGVGPEPPTEWIRQHEVAIPMRDAVIRWERVAGLPVAPEEAIIYDYDESTREGTGARWRAS